ncbi:flavin-containing monooxygenase [Nocardia brevicatena]|uniref:flavin-containing monooxygenase n=1 Tax=Nocardia brevicatena TaxID=37327 RepID=UPI0002E5E8B0|nr:NAD(P)/FAD-dependent oxidoreductase [Nocardia brevicatena]
MKAQRNDRHDQVDLAAMIEQAGIPLLLPALVQLTGDLRWLEERYRPCRPVGFVEDPTGGLDPEGQAEIRAAAVDAVSRWHKGELEPELPVPGSHLMAALMSQCLGAPVPEDYAPMLSEQLGLRPYKPERMHEQLAGRDFSVAVIGAGISGLAAARSLAAAGIPYTVLEKNSEVGGTWWENRYPGARVDVPSNLYSFSFIDKQWSEHFSQRDEISEYLVRASHELGIRDAIRFGVEVHSARWDAGRQVWVLSMTTPQGTETLQASALITAVGLHNRPKIPDFPGLGDFAGEVAHSAQWPEGLDLTGKRVGVIGAGASAMQVVPAVVDRTAHLTVFQRSAHWVAPNDLYFQHISAADHWLLENVPFYREWNRFRLYWMYTEGMFPALEVDPEWDISRNSVNRYSEALRRFYTDYLNSRLRDRPDLVEACTPTFPPFGRRILIDNGWFDVLKRDDVDLVRSGISRLTPTGVVTTDGDEVKLDVLVLCTGFQQQRYLYPLEVTGLDGRELREEWRDDNARAYLGLAGPGYPNLFYLFGPNTNPPGGSYINLAEAQVRYVTDLLVTMARDGIGAVEVRQDVYADYNERLDAANRTKVFALDGVESYYRNSTGRVVTNSPWTVLQYWNMTQRPDLNDYVVSPAPTSGSN